MALDIVIVCLLMIIDASSPFFIRKPSRNTLYRPLLNANKLSLNDVAATQSSFHLQAVEIFDGSTVVDPVVVSGVFWSSLKAKLLSVVIGQIIATIAFSAITIVFSVQLKNLGESLSKTLFEGDGIKMNTNKMTGALLPKRNTSLVEPDYAKLLLCIVIDILGTSSEFIPIIGEFTDIIYAPVAAILLRSLYGNSNIVFVIEFFEEFLLFTDILPLATICWVSHSVLNYLVIHSQVH